MSAKGYLSPFRTSWLTRAYDPLIAHWPAGVQTRQTVRAALDLTPGLRLLELGCGSGRLAVEIKRYCPQVSIKAVDANSTILQVARRRAAQAGVDVEFTQGDITQLAVDGSYDRIYSTLVLHHLIMPAKQQTLRRVRELLDAGGKFVVADFSRPQGRLQALLARTTGWGDHLHTTAPHRDGRFEEAVRAHFTEVQSLARLPSLFGTIEVWSCRL
jgi:ubiquinone/menaquinone biosynthesis C-methylase UbiE